MIHGLCPLSVTVGSNSASVDFQYSVCRRLANEILPYARCKRGMSIRHTPYEYEFIFAKGHYGKSINPFAPVYYEWVRGYQRRRIIRSVSTGHPGPLPIALRDERMQTARDIPTNDDRTLFEEGRFSRSELLHQLERLVSSKHFRNSKRYPSFLRFVVEQTLAGKTESLKERTLGIDVFARPNDYDTNADPIVRVTAGEIRKRIAQYYQEPGHEDELRIDLPLGSYVPHFLPANHLNHTAEHDHLKDLGIAVVAVPSDHEATGPQAAAPLTVKQPLYDGVD